MSELRCPRCGNVPAEATRFCPECGAPLPEATSTTPSSAGQPTMILPPEPASSATPSVLPPPASGTEKAASGPKRRTLWWIIGGVGCLALLLVAACGGLFLTLLGEKVPPTSRPVAATPASGGILPDNSPLVGGDVLLQEDFSTVQAANLEASEDELSRSFYEDESYIIAVKKSETLVWSMIGGHYEHVRIQIDTEPLPDSDLAAAGLVFHYQDKNNFYLFSVSNDGYYMLELLKQDTWTTLIDQTQSDAIRTGRNTLRVETSDNHIALYVNDTLLEETVDDTFTAGDAGLAVSTFTKRTGTIRFDNLLITKYEP